MERQPPECFTPEEAHCLRGLTPPLARTALPCQFRPPRGTVMTGESGGPSMSGSEAVETILIVDDEAPVRKTFLDWLREADLGCTVLTAGDAKTALELANEHVIDLAVLDWNLGAGDDGLHLLK